NFQSFWNKGVLNFSFKNNKIRMSGFEPRLPSPTCGRGAGGEGTPTERIASRQGHVQRAPYKL
ncbi:MAG: hypothetical protein PHI11_15010, partial [Gallionella sp.]|nr:hypothetical protein [Gallionella sp.]